MTIYVAAIREGAAAAIRTTGGRVVPTSVASVSHGVVSVVTADGVASVPVTDVFLLKAS